MERNQVIGLLLITLLMIGYFMYFGGQQPEKTGINADTVVVDKKTTTPIVQNEVVADSVSSAENQQKYGVMASAAKGEAKDIILENEDIKVILSTLGGSVKKVLLKKYFTDDKKPLFLVDSIHNSIDLITRINSKNVDLTELYFQPSITTVEGKNVVSFRLQVSPEKYVEQVYALGKDGYLVDYDIRFVGLDNVVDNAPLEYVWKANLPKVEYDLEQSRIRSTINYYTAEEEFETLSETQTDEQVVKVDAPIKWVALKQKFFNSGIISKTNSFSSGVLLTNVKENDTLGIKYVQANLFIPAQDLKLGKGNFSYYFGPNHYQTLRGVTEGYGKNVYLGWPVINWINRFIVIPVFNFLDSFIDNYGIIIIILVFLLKLLLFPLSYKSYISMAKMKVLKPELDEIKEKYPNDLQKQQGEQMQLYQKVGINPLSGCIPVLLQMPILLAMFNFFPNSIELRQESFLWAHDLSTYDAPFLLPFTIPFYGSHVSLFTLLMTISTIVLTYFNNQTSTVTGPMKSMSYIMPVVFMFVLNSFPAGLSFYYFASNLVTIAQQFFIRKFVDEDKIRMILDENRKKNATGTGKKSKWMQRVEEAMKAKEEQNRKGGKK